MPPKPAGKARASRTRDAGLLADVAASPSSNDTVAVPVDRKARSVNTLLRVCSVSCSPLWLRPNLVLSQAFGSRPNLVDLVEDEGTLPAQCALCVRTVRTVCSQQKKIKRSRTCRRPVADSNTTVFQKARAAALCAACASTLCVVRVCSVSNSVVCSSLVCVSVCVFVCSLSLSSPFLSLLPRRRTHRTRRGSAAASHTQASCARSALRYLPSPSLFLVGRPSAGAL